MQNNTNFIHLACLLEATARKAGNVHPGASFEHLCYDDFVRSAEAVAPILAAANPDTVGSTILDAVTATRAICEHNTNLGIILLLAPLASVPVKDSIVEGLPFVLRGLSARDSFLVFRAIRLANPRGLGTSPEQDVKADPNDTLVRVMRLAKHRDAVAQQYSNGFRLVLGDGLNVLKKYRDFHVSWETAIVHLQLELMALLPDTDIARKCGKGDAKQSAKLARAVLDAGWPTSEESQKLFVEFDRWLRAKGSLRSPGTTADLITACVFVGLRDRILLEPKLADVCRIADEIRASAATAPA